MSYVGHLGGPRRETKRRVLEVTNEGVYAGFREDSMEALELSKRVFFGGIKGDY